MTEPVSTFLSSHFQFNASSQLVAESMMAFLCQKFSYTDMLLAFLLLFRCFFDRSASVMMLKAWVLLLHGIPISDTLLSTET